MRLETKEIISELETINLSWPQDYTIQTKDTPGLYAPAATTTIESKAQSVTKFLEALPTLKYLKYQITIEVKQNQVEFTLKKRRGGPSLNEGRVSLVANKDGKGMRTINGMKHLDIVQEAINNNRTH